MTVGANIQKLRKKLGLSQEELAGKLLLTRQTISQWETEQTMPILENIKLLKNVFGVYTDEILVVNDKPESVRNTDSLDSI